jgi:hypothetical protein
MGQDMKVVIINEATSSPIVGQVTVPWLNEVAGACEAQLNGEVARSWANGALAMRVGRDSTDVQPGEMVFAILDALPDAPGAIAYHDVNGNDVPTAFLALSTCNTLDDVSTAMSHEFCETAGDWACNIWADSGQGKEYARELCDACESNWYTRPGSSIKLSDFLLPVFFEPGSTEPFTFVQHRAGDTAFVTGSGVAGYPSAPFATAPGGYQIERNSGTGEASVQGEIRPVRAAKVAHFSSRVSRRLAHNHPKPKAPDAA